MNTFCINAVQSMFSDEAVDSNRSLGALECIKVKCIHYCAYKLSIKTLFYILENWF